MAERIVIALGGNALGRNLPEQMAAVKHTAKAIVDLIESGRQVVVSHGNGPQVGMIQKAMTELTRSHPEKYITCPLSVCVAMSQGYIGYDLQNALREELLDRGIGKGVATWCPCSIRSAMALAVCFTAIICSGRLLPRALPPRAITIRSAI